MPRRRKWRSSAHTRKPVSAPQKPNATTHSVFGTILGLSHARAGLWGRCGTALARGHPNRGRSQRRIPSTDSSNRSLRTQTDRCRGRRTSCGRPLVPQAQRAPQCRRSKPPYPFPGLLPGLAAGSLRQRWRAPPRRPLRRRSRPKNNPALFARRPYLPPRQASQALVCSQPPAWTPEVLVGAQNEVLAEVP